MANPLLTFSFLLCLCICECLVLWPGTSGGTERAATTHTDCGPVQGSFVQADNAYAFRGIPYAEPPVGQRRWRPPVAVAPKMNNCWNGTLVAQQFGSTCYQRDSIKVTKYVGNEDCLYLNVWTPSLTPSKPLPVMFWIHGGYLLFGNGNQQDIGYAPTTKLARDTDMVYVSLNYRLQAFGFMALEWLRDKSAHNTSGNYGFMDQIAALHWVQRNIHNFGGDPNQVTVFGQSSGGTSIYALLASPLCAGLFHKAWLLSASPVFNKTATDAFKDNEVFVRNTKCVDVDCLYSLSAHDVTSSVPWDEYPYWAMADLLGLPVRGRFDGAVAIVDGYVLPEAPFEAWVRGHGNDVPILIGTTAQETDVLSEPVSITNWTWSSGRYQQHVRDTLGTFSDVLAETALGLYPAGTGTPELQLTTMASDVRMTCGTDYLALVAATSFTSPVYRYVTTYWPSSPADLFSFGFPASYSAHGIDMFAFYGSMDKVMSKPTATDHQWESNVQHEVLAFVRGGHPASSEWKPYPGSTALLSGNTTVVQAYHGVECEFWLANGMFPYSWIN